MTSSRRHPGADLKGWVFVAPALIWTAAFFVVPFAVMAAVSLSEPGGSADSA